MLSIDQIKLLLRMRLSEYRYNHSLNVADEAARRVLDGENVIGSALYFYAPALSQGVWINASCTYQQTIGCHRFYL